MSILADRQECLSYWKGHRLFQNALTFALFERTIMHRTILLCWLAIVLTAVTASAKKAKQPEGPPPEAADLLAPWRKPAAVRPVDSDAQRHSIHTYYLTSPESPDGRFVLYYTSTASDAQQGELRVLERASGQQRVVSRNLVTEDAHRVACQQWLSQGKRVVFHTLRDGTWLVAAVELDSGKEQVLAKDRLVGFVQPKSDLVPVYGCHWKPGEHHDLELVNAATGDIRTVVTAAAVKAAYPDFIQQAFGDHEISIFFPVLSPNLKRVFWKMASPAGGDYNSKQASNRYGLICYDLEQAKFLFSRGKWGHPGWAPDSQSISEVGNTLLDATTGATRRFAGTPSLPGEHPSVSPDGKLFVKDGPLAGLGGAAGEWGIVVGRIDGGGHVIVHRFDQSHGARSWRISHPHPSFSPDGKRIYFNVSATEWTRLYVAESGAAAAGK
jgi:hypothetical protein